MEGPKITRENWTKKQEQKQSTSTERAEAKITTELPIEELSKILGANTYLVGGAVRDYLFDKKPNDFDLMSRISLEEAVNNLISLDFKERQSKLLKNKEFVINKDEKSDNPALRSGVLTFVLDNKEFQVGFIGNKDYSTLINEGDINISCAAFSLSERKIIDTNMANKIAQKVLQFNNPEMAKRDPEKVLNALRAISRFPDLRVPQETLLVIKSCMPVLVKYFSDNPNKKYKLATLLGNINSEEILDIFKEHNALELFSGLEFKKGKLLVSSPYLSCRVEDLDESMKTMFSSFLESKFGKRFKPEKVFNDKVNSVVYEINNSGKLICCCLVDGERLYTVASNNQENIINLVSNLRKNNYNVWATISIHNRLLIKMAEKAGLSAVTDENILRKILVNHYPQYKDKIITEKQGEQLFFKKRISDNNLQVLVWS